MRPKQKDNPRGYSMYLPKMTEADHRALRVQAAQLGITIGERISEILRAAARDENLIPHAE